MENIQSLPNQQSTEASVQKQVSQNTSRLFMVVIASILLTGIVTGLIVYFWQKSASEKAFYSLEQKISSLEKQISTKEKLEVAPTPTLDQTENWTTYTSSQYNYLIRYPNEDTQVLEDPTSYDFHVAIEKSTEDGFPFPVRSIVAVRILQNPNNFSLPKLGNQTFATDAPEPYDLEWKTTTFAGQSAFKTTWQSPGDGGTLYIHLLTHNGNIYAIWYASIDKNYDKLANQILTTFQFID